MFILKGFLFIIFFFVLLFIVSIAMLLLKFGRFIHIIRNGQPFPNDGTTFNNRPYGNTRSNTSEQNTRKQTISGGESSAPKKERREDEEYAHFEEL